MVLARWQGAILDDDGNALEGAQITVQREVSGAPLATVYSDRDGLTPLGNPFTQQEAGYAFFHAAGGAYRITATLGDLTRTWRYVALGTAAEADISAEGIALVQSVDAGYAMNFETGTSAPPGAGGIRFNNADLSAATLAYVSVENAAGSDITERLEELFDAARTVKDGIILADPANNRQATFQVTSVNLVGSPPTYAEIGVGSHAGETSFLAGSLTFQRDRAGADGTDGSNGTNGTDGVSAGLPFTFSSTTSMADPGAGQFRLNNATLASVTAMAIDDTSAASGNPDVSPFVLAWDDSTNNPRGYLTIKRAAAPENFAVYAITGASTDNSGWTQLALTHVTSSGSLGNGNLCTIEFSRVGNVGDTGPAAVGLMTIWVPAAAMTARATSGAGSSTYDSGSNDVSLPVLDFDTTTQEYAHFCIGMPKSWNEGTVSFIPYWTAAGGTAAQTVVWSLAGVAISNDDTLNAARGTVQTSSDALIAANDLHIGPESSAITIGGTPAEGDLVVFEVSRVVGSDNLSVDAKLIGIKLLITTNAATDA